MLRNQSFSVSGTHSDDMSSCFYSSRAKVRQNFGTGKLFLKKASPNPSEGGEYELVGSLSPPLEGLGGDFRGMLELGFWWTHIGDDEFRCYFIANDMQTVVFQIMGMTLRRGKVCGRNLHFKVLKILRRAEFIECFLCAPINQLVNDAWGIFIGTHEFVCNPADTIANIFYIDCNFARPRKYHGGIPFSVTDADVPTFNHRLSGSIVSKS